MTEKRNRWMINTVLVMAVIAFVGFSMIPLLSSAIREEPATKPTTAATASTTTEAKRTELEAQAKGYELVLQREPDNQTALRGLVDAKLALRDIPGAIEPLEKLAKLNPDQTSFGVLLAQAKQYQKDYEGAAQVYRTILNSKPTDLKALQGMMGLLLEQNRPEAAIGLLQDALKSANQSTSALQPDMADPTSIQLMLGQVYAAQGRFEEATAIYDEAIKGNKQDFRPVLGKAIILKAQGKTEEAKPLFNSATALAPAQYKDSIKKLASEAVPGQTTPSPSSSTTPPSPTPSAAPASP